MEARRETQKGTNHWWQLHWPRDERIWKSPKVLAVQMAHRPTFIPAKEPAYVPFSVNVFVPGSDTPEDLNYFAGLLNSKLLWHWFLHYAKRRGVALEVNGGVLSRAPIHSIDFSVRSEKARHDRISQVVSEMVEAKQQSFKSLTDKDKNYYESKCSRLDHQIDSLVYELYGLTEDEIGAVESAVKNEDAASHARGKKSQRDD